MNDNTVNRWKWLELAVAVLLIIAVCLGLYLRMQRLVVVEIEEKAYEYKSLKKTVGEFLENEGISVQAKGYLNYPLDAKLVDKMHLVIKHPKEYNVYVGGDENLKLESPFTTVREVLEDGEISLGSLDYTEPSLDHDLKNGDVIKVYRVEEVIRKEEVKIPFNKKVKDSKNLDKGQHKIVQEGKNGLKTQKYKDRFVNGELVASELLNESLVAEAVDQITERGTRQLVASSRGNSKAKKSDKPISNGSKTIVMNASAYDDSAASQGKWVGTTALGTTPKRGVVAVDPKVIPLGTKLYIESLDSHPDYGYARAEDTGGAIKGNKIDLFYPSRGEVYNFGRRKVRVHILK